MRLYTNKMNNRNFANAESLKFDFEKTSLLFAIRAVFPGSKTWFSAKSKTDTSSCLWVYRLVVVSFFLTTSSLFCVPYVAHISGVSDTTLRQAIEKDSLAFSSPEKTTPSKNALRLRANNDIDRIINVAVFNGYYDCSVEPVLSEEGPLTVDFVVNLGQQSNFGTLTLNWLDKDLVLEDLSYRKESPSLAKGPSAKDLLSFNPNKPATGKAIIDLDAELLKSLRSRAFAFAKVVTKRIEADRANHVVNITIDVQTGPITRFGKTSISGSERVRPEFFHITQNWKEGDLYSPKAIETTENALQHSGLFQSVQIDEAKDLVDDWALPITTCVTEGKPRTIGAGLNYTTTYGAGLSAEWEHRNISGLGRKISANLELWQKLRSASLSYTLPHIGEGDQNFIWLLEYDHQHYLPFSSSAYQLSPLIDQEINPKTRAVYGLCFERIESTGIIGHHLYHLIKVPLQLLWSNANSPIDPTKGLSYTLHLTPSYQILNPHYRYLIHTSTLCAYRSILNDQVTFAGRIGLGDVFGAGKNSIPLPDRFFGGSQNSLRGYKTGSVSPLNQYRKPKGGRSILTGSFEVRTRTKGIGWAAFYDIGNVYRTILPTPISGSLLHSVGAGIRYSTPIGPLRLDIAFPIHRRRHIDSWCQLYFSIGQAF